MRVAAFPPLISNSTVEYYSTLPSKHYLLTMHYRCAPSILALCQASHPSYRGSRQSPPRDTAMVSPCIVGILVLFVLDSMASSRFGHLIASRFPVLPLSHGILFFVCPINSILTLQGIHLMGRDSRKEGTELLYTRISSIYLWTISAQALPTLAAMKSVGWPHKSSIATHLL